MSIDDGKSREALIAELHDLRRRVGSHGDIDGSPAAVPDDRPILSLLPVGVYTCDVNGVITYYNQSAVAIWGRDPGLDAPEVRYCGSLRLYRADGSVLSHDQTPMAAAVREGRRTRGEQVVIERPDGSRVTVAVHIEPLRDAGGQVVGAINVMMDITARREAEEALRESEKRFRVMADGLPLIIWVHDAEGRQEFVNQTFCDYFGVTRAQARDGHWQVLMHPDDAQQYRSTFLSCLRERRPFHAEVRVKRADGEWRWLESWGRPRIAGDGSFRGMVGTSADVTERKAAEEQLVAAKEELEHANQAKDRFLAALSHELRTPLAPVLLTVGMLEQDESLSAAVREDLASIRHSVGIEVRLIDDLLDLTRVARGKVNLRPSVTDVHDLVRHAIESCCDDAFRAKGLRLEVKLAARQSVMRVDPARIEQVIWNLLRNAIKFTPQGGLIQVESCNPEPAVLQVRVTDTGVGIAPDLLVRIFDAFDQGQEGTHRQFGGLGLGLAIAKSMVELHGGRIAAHSDGHGRGACFTVDLPIVAAAGGGDMAARPSCDDGQVAEGAPACILLVEDHEPTGRAVMRLLESMGHEVVHARSVSAAMHEAARGRFDLVVSDLGLPDGTGHDLMRYLWREHQLVGIALTGYGSEEDIRLSVEAGFAEHLLKPVNARALHEAINRRLGLVASAGSREPGGR